MSIPTRPPRSTVNVPAAIGVAVVFLAGVIVWVVASQMTQDEVTTPSVPSTSAVTTPSTVPDVTTTTTTTTVVSEPTARPGETTPIPLPSNAPKQDGSKGVTTVPKPTAAPPSDTKAPSGGGASGDDGNSDDSSDDGDSSGNGGSGGGSSGGDADLGISGYPIQQPTCDGAFVTVVASIVGKDDAAERVKSVLDRYPDGNYLRTDRSCASFSQSSNGQPIFVVFLGPFAQPADACEARVKAADDAYIKRLSNDPNAGGAKCD